MFNWPLSISSTALKSVKSLSPSTSSSSLSFNRTFLTNITRSPFYQSLTSLDKTKLWSKFYVDDEESIQKVLDVVSIDQKVITDPHLNRKRRSVIVTRKNDEPFGFTLQTYLVKRNGDYMPSKVTYIDYVHLDSPAFDAGIRAGDTIVSINGHIVTAMSHGELIKLISSYRQMRMIVIFENIRQRIELVARAIKLQKILNDKLYQLNLIDIEEQTILNRAYSRSLSRNATKYSPTNSLSSGGTVSDSSVCSAFASSAPITTNDPLRSIIRIPTIISLTNEGKSNIYQLRKRSSQRSCCLEISNPNRLDMVATKVTGTIATESLANQRIFCFKSESEYVNGMSSILSYDSERTTNHSNFHDDDDRDVDDGDDNTDNISSNSCLIVENDNDSGNLGTAAITDDVKIRNATDNDDETTNVSDHVANRSNAGTAIPVPISKSVFNSIALNHVIMLDDDNDDVISGKNDDNTNKIMIIKL